MLKRNLEKGQKERQELTQSVDILTNDYKTQYNF